MKTLFRDMSRLIYHYLKSKNQREFYRLYDKLGNRNRFEMIRDVKFFKYKFDIPDAPSFIWQFKDIFVDEVYKFKSEHKIPVIFDCGSNIGTSILYFRQNYGNAKIIGFEADENIADICIRNLKRNNINNVNIIKNAVWIDDKGVDFSIDGADGGSIMNFENIKRKNSIRLKDYLQKEEIISMLKIDIEGAEHKVLCDCSDSLGNVENIFIEYHSWNNSDQKLSEILNILERNNFRYYIESINKRIQPFINQSRDGNMDLQLNIFGYKLKEAE